MATQVQFRGGSSTEHNSFTGAAREVTVDTTKNTVVIHDGSTAGGHALAKENNPTFTGNVGVGVSPSTNLHVGGSTPTLRVSNGTSQIVELKADTSASILRTTTNHPLLFGTNDTERMRIYSSGNIKLNGDSPFLYLSDNDNNWIRGSSQLSQIRFGTNNSEKMRIDSSGNVLVGKTSSTGLTAGCELRPAGLGVFTRASANPLQVRRLTDDGDLIEFYQDSGLIGSIGVQGSSLTVGMAGVERLRIESSGNVNIVGTGTTATPKIVLNANGSITAAGSINTESEVKTTRFGTPASLGAATDAAIRVGTAADTKAKIGYDGSAEFAGGSVSVNTSSSLGRLQVNRTNTGKAFVINNNTNDTVTILGNGSITAAGSGTFGNEVYVQGTDATTQRYLNFVRPTSGQYRATLRRDAWYLGETVTNIGNVTPTGANIVLNMSGSATFAGSITANGTVLTSDQRFKENITPANPQLADIKALGAQLKNFDWNADAPSSNGTRQLGLIAQDVETVCPGIVKTIARTKQGAELTPEVVVPAVYETRTVPAVLDDEGEVVEAETTEQVLVTEEQVTPATYEELDDSYKGISHDALIMKLLGAVAELSAKVAALESA